MDNFRKNIEEAAKRIEERRQQEAPEFFQLQCEIRAIFKANKHLNGEEWQKVKRLLEPKRKRYAELYKQQEAKLYKSERGGTADTRISKIRASQHEGSNPSVPTKKGKPKRDSRGAVI